MDHFEKIHSQIFTILLVGLLVIGASVGLVWFLFFEIIMLNEVFLLPSLILVGITMAAYISLRITDVVLIPLKAIADAIIHVSPSHETADTSAPNIDNVRIGRNLVNSLSMVVYQLASGHKGEYESKQSHRESVIQAINVINHLPLPLFVFNNQRIVTHASEIALNYIGSNSATLFGKPLEDSLRLEFPSELTLEKWVEDCQEKKVTSTMYWERVRVKMSDESVRQCDINALYNRDNPSGADFIVTLFDKTERYNLDDDATSFVTLAVHELRTPLTMLRGYIEVFQEELAGQLNEELGDYMQKMSASASQLNIFVNNILNVSKIEQNQLMMQLDEANWTTALGEILDDMELRTRTHGITIERSIASDLPSVGVDRVSAYEVIANLIDNAIKYSGGSKRIVVNSRIGNSGMVETTVQDFGVGMPANATANLFEKFYRNHRTRNQVGGTGLGLYLIKAIVSAHGGQVWVNSKEGQGSTFGFSLMPYDQLDDSLKSGDNKKEILRQSHGWIKNHSMYRK
jgi:signal transduction histidine kinase